MEFAHDGIGIKPEQWSEPKLLSEAYHLLWREPPQTSTQLSVVVETDPAAIPAISWSSRVS